MRVKPQLLIPVVLAGLLAGCATPEARVRTGLVNAGLSPRLADCMAHRMTERLSLTQLRRLGDLPRARESLSAGEFLHHVRALHDSEIVGVTTSAAALCASGLAR